MPGAVTIRKIFLGIGLLCACVPGIQAQDGSMGQVLKQFQDQRNQLLQEKVFVHTDKTMYLSGETIWFRIYDVDGQFNKPLGLSKVSYVEILSRDLKPVLQTKIAMKDGAGNGSLVVPLSVNSGNYILRAYTSWMKNFSPDYYFEQPITLVNVLKRPEWAKEEISKAFDVQFFPEGGNLVAGLESIVAYRMTNQYGKGMDGDGYIVGSSNDTIVRFRPYKFGLGHFSFTPQSNQHYQAVIRINDTILKQDIPVVQNDGYVMKLSEDKDQLTVRVSGSSNYANLNVYLFVQTRNVVKAIFNGTLDGGTSSFSIDKKQLGDGISQLTVFNSNRQPVCERLYFKKPGTKLLVENKADQPVYGLRKKVNLDITTSGAGNAPVEADMSMSVFRMDSLQVISQPDIYSYLLLASDLKGAIESPAYYLSNTGSETDEAINNLMLTHGWRRLIWNDILQNKTPELEFVPEFDGHVVTGRVTDKRTGQPADKIVTYLSVPGTKFRLNISTSNQKGQIKFDVKDFLGASEVVVQTNTHSDSLYRIDIATPFSEKYGSRKAEPFNLPESSRDELLFTSIHTQSQNNFSINRPVKFIVPDQSDSSVFYGKPDRKYFLDDYTRFITMEEVMREYIGAVRLRKQGNSFHMQAENIPYQSYFDLDPLVMIDGIPIFDISRIIAFDPLKIKKIEVVARKYFLDSVVNQGIVSYTTYNGDLAGFQMDPNALVLEYPGMQIQREFFTPVYESQEQAESRIPDFRTVLQWSPGLRSDAKGKKQLSFYTSDIPGKYGVIIQGLTSEGLSGSSFTSFEVKR